MCGVARVICDVSRCVNRVFVDGFADESCDCDDFTRITFRINSQVAQRETRHFGKAISLPPNRTCPGGLQVESAIVIDHCSHDGDIRTNRGFFSG